MNSRKKNKGLKCWMIISLVVVGIFVIWSVVFLIHFSKDVEIMFESEKIHGAVEVNIENMFDSVEGEFSEEVKAGVLGNYAVLCDSLGQFLELAPEGTIYTFFELGKKESKFLKTGRYYSLSKTYLAVVSEVGAIIYSDLYEYREGNRRYWIEGWSWGEDLGKINFHYDNKEDIIVCVGVLACIIIGLVLFFGFASMPYYLP